MEKKVKQNEFCVAEVSAKGPLQDSWAVSFASSPVAQLWHVMPTTPFSQ